MKALDASLTFSAKEITHSAAAEAIQTIDTRLANERSRLEKAVEEAEQGVSSIKSMGQGMEKTLLAAQKAASEVGVATNFVHFREEASNHNRMSKFWLSATIGLSLTTLMFAGWSLYYGVCSTADISVSHCLQVAIPKLVILSILYAASVWAGRIYKAHRHNYVVNRHRQNALSSFEAFVQAALDDATKNAVLLEATRSIFSQQPSGYMTKEPEPTGGSTQILEVIKGVLPGNH
jgi:hypothetical protein